MKKERITDNIIEQKVKSKINVSYCTFITDNSWMLTSTDQLLSLSSNCVHLCVILLHQTSITCYSLHCDQRITKVPSLSFICRLLFRHKTWVMTGQNKYTWWYILEIINKLIKCGSRRNVALVSTFITVMSNANSHKLKLKGTGWPTWWAGSLRIIGSGVTNFKISGWGVIFCFVCH